MKANLLINNRCMHRFLMKSSDPRIIDLGYLVSDEIKKGSGPTLNEVSYLEEIARLASFAEKISQEVKLVNSPILNEVGYLQELSRLKTSEDQVYTLGLSDKLSTSMDLRKIVDKALAIEAEIQKKKAEETA